MKVLSAVAFAVIGICLTQANAVPTAQYNKDEPVALVTNNLQRSVATAVDVFAKSDKPITDILEKIFQRIREVYKTFRTAVIARINSFLKRIHIKFDVEVWLDSFENKILGCGKSQKEEIKNESKQLLEDVLTCVQTNTDKFEEIMDRGVLALEILRKAVPHFRTQYEDCKKSCEKPSQPAKSETFVAEGKGIERLICLGTAVGETAILLRPVPGHLYTLAKLVHHISFNAKKEVIKCFVDKSLHHLMFLKETFKTIAVCVAFSI